MFFAILTNKKSKRDIITPFRLYELDAYSDAMKFSSDNWEKKIYSAEVVNFNFGKEENENHV